MNPEDISAIILDHYRRREHFSELKEPRLQGEKINRSCGDELSLYLRLGPEAVTKTGAGPETRSKQKRS